MVLLHLTNNILTARALPLPLIWRVFSASSNVLHWHRENHEENKSRMNVGSIIKTPGGALSLFYRSTITEMCLQSQGDVSSNKPAAPRDDVQQSSHICGETFISHQQQKLNISIRIYNHLMSSAWIQLFVCSFFLRERKRCVELWRRQAGVQRWRCCFWLAFPGVAMILHSMGIHKQTQRGQLGP